MYDIHMGFTEMEEFWNNLYSRVRNSSATKDEIILYKKLGKVFKLLSGNPRHPGLESHEISSLSKRYGMKVWESYLENRTLAAVRFFLRDL